MKWLLSLLLVLWTSSALAATTYYVRVNGGTTTQCTGTNNSDYGGSGTAQACAYNHPAWALGALGTSGSMTGGDTLIIDDNSGAATYQIGIGMPNTQGCTSGASQNCVLNSPPSGPDSAHPTRILGSAYTSGCATKPQLWGTEGANQIFQIYSRSNLEYQCLDLTDHSTCMEFYGANQCNRNFGSSSVGLWARSGFRGTYVTNLTLKNVDIHGFARQGILMGDTSGIINFDHVNSIGNAYNGWDGDDRQLGGSGSITSGTVSFNYVKIKYNGCQETYPRATAFLAADYTNCTDASQSNDGIGSADTGGTWTITNSDISFNASDGLDLRYCSSCASVSIDKSVFEGNEGNQLKVTSKNLNITNDIVIGNCAYFSAANKAYSIAEPCRAGGVPIYLSPRAGSVFKINNNTVYAATDNDTSAVFEIFDTNGQPNGTETYSIKNNVFVSPTSPSGVSWTPFYSGLSGAAQTAFNALTQDHNLIYNFQTNPAGTGNVFTNPQWTSSINNGATTNVNNVTLQVSSPAKGAAAAGASFWNTSKDYNNFPQNSPIDMGAMQYGTTNSRSIAAGQACIATSDCASGTCTNFACSGSCTANSGACAASSTCCSGYCNGSICANPPTCGDGVIQSPEVCDGSALNGVTCIQLGYQGGSNACAGNCLSYDTAGCTSSTVFPLSPILDSGTRANQGPPPSSSWGHIFGDGLKILSNSFALVAGPNTETADYWNGLAATADQEVYGTLSTLGSLAFYIRTNSQASTGYLLSYSSGDITLYKLPAVSTLATYSSVGMSNGDAFGASAIGSSIKVYKRVSGSWSVLGTTSDSTYTSGLIGIYTGDASVRLTNFGGGPVNPVVCGNGLKEGNEVCDGADLASQTCITQNFASGTLTCASNCGAFNTTSCVTASTCGNNTKQTGELCDGTDLNSQTCVGLGYGGGTLSCLSTCLGFDTTRCTGNTRIPGTNRGFATNRGFV